MHHQDTPTRTRHFAIAPLLLLGVLYAGSAFAIAKGVPSDLPVVSPEWDSGKELKLKVKLHLGTKGSAGSVSAKVGLALNYEETGVIQVGDKKVTLLPTKTSGTTVMIFEVFNPSDRVVYRASVPFENEADISARPDFEETGLSHIELFAGRS